MALYSSTTTVVSSSGGVTLNDVDTCNDEDNVINGISEWDEIKEASHLPSALRGLGTVERAQWLEQQRVKEKEESAKVREIRRDALKASQERSVVFTCFVFLYLCIS